MLLRRLAVALGLILAAAVVVVVIRAYEGRAPDLSAADWSRWQRTEADLVRQCSYRRPQTPTVRQAETVDMSALVSIARAHSSATAPSELSPDEPRIPMTGLVGYVGFELACRRPDLIREAWRVANSLPGGYTVRVSPLQELSFRRASDDFQKRCGRNAADSVAAARRDATVMVALNRAAPHAHLLATLGVERPQNHPGGGMSLPWSWFDMTECDPRAVAILAHGVGATPSQIGG